MFFKLPSISRLAYKWTLFFYSIKCHISNSSADDREDLIDLFLQRIKYNTLRKKHMKLKRRFLVKLSQIKKSFPMFVIHSSNCQISRVVMLNFFYRIMRLLRI